MAEKEYIERGEAINQFTTNGGVFVYGVKGVAAIISRLRATPAADVVEVRHGVWESAGIFGDMGRCSVCGTIGHSLHEIYSAERYNFCPYCGAKMDGKGEGEC